MTSELDGIDLQLLLPELLLTLGLAAIIIIPNLGDAKFRIPLTSFRIPVLIGGTRFPATRDPRLPNWMTLGTLSAALVARDLRLAVDLHVANQRPLRDRRLAGRGLPLVALQQAFSHVYQPMVTTYETWGDAGDVHDFVTMVTKFDNFLGFALPWPRCTRHCSV